MVSLCQIFICWIQSTSSLRWNNKNILINLMINKLHDSDVRSGVQSLPSFWAAWKLLRKTAAFNNKHRLKNASMIWLNGVWFLCSRTHQKQDTCTRANRNYQREELKLWGKPYEQLKATSAREAFYPEGILILPVAQCKEKRNKLQPFWSLGSPVRSFCLV